MLIRLQNHDSGDISQLVLCTPQPGKKGRRDKATVFF